MLTSQQIKDSRRWYDLPNLSRVHLEYWNSSARFRIVKAGRRSYKTEIAKRIIIENALKIPGTYFVGAPTIPQVKKIYWKDLVDMSFRSFQRTTPNKSELIIPFDNGSEIHLLGMEKPKRFEGPYWTGGILDEFAYFKEEAWTESIRPALDTQVPGMKPPWCIILSKPNGQNHFYDRWEYALTANDTDWQAFEWTSELVLSAAAIDAAKRELSLKQYRQEYLGEFVTECGLICEDYGPDNYTNEVIRPHEIIHYYADFNYTPMSHGVGVRRDNNIYLLDEIILESAVAEQNALEFVERYREHKNKTLFLFGDPSGKNGEKHGHRSDYTAMEKVFREHGWSVSRKVRNSHPAIRDRQNAVRAKIKNAKGEVSLYCNPKTAKWTHKALSTVQTKKGSSFLEDDTNPYQHIFTAVGYMIDYLWPVSRSNISITIHDFGLS